MRIGFTAVLRILSCIAAAAAPAEGAGLTVTDLRCEYGQTAGVDVPHRKAMPW